MVGVRAGEANRAPGSGAGEEDHFEVLSRYSKVAGGRHVSLHIAELQHPRSVVKVLEVREAGETVDQLTPATSISLEPMYN